MNEMIGKYFSGELSENEKLHLLIDIYKTPILKDEFIQIQNLLGLTVLLPRTEDVSIGKAKLSESYEKYTKNKIV